ncbi:MAG TPA: hypothetical protein VE131_01560 [Terriglobales bacterium]|nr:hypothetical protein [Terriglobales bacterium]
MIVNGAVIRVSLPITILGMFDTTLPSMIGREAFTFAIIYVPEMHKLNVPAFNRSS